MVAVNNWHLGDVRNVPLFSVESDFLYKFQKRMEMHYDPVFVATFELLLTTRF